MVRRKLKGLIIKVNHGNCFIQICDWFTNKDKFIINELFFDQFSFSTKKLDYNNNDNK